MIPNGGPAFPIPFIKTANSGMMPTTSMFDEVGGMSLRDWFASQALSGIIASYSGENVQLPEAIWAAARAYKYADAMLAERDRKY